MGTNRPRTPSPALGPGRRFMAVVAVAGALMSGCNLEEGPQYSYYYSGQGGYDDVYVHVHATRQLVLIHEICRMDIACTASFVKTFTFTPGGHLDSVQWGELWSSLPLDGIDRLLDAAVYLKALNGGQFGAPACLGINWNPYPWNSYWHREFLPAATHSRCVMGEPAPATVR